MGIEQNQISNRVVYSGWDFQQALSALTFLMEDCDFDKKYTSVELRRFRCYETSMIIAFCRPFKAGRGRENLDLDMLSLQLNEKESEIKKKLVFLRDKLVGHSDEEEMQFNFESFHPYDDHEVRLPSEQFNETLYFTEIELYGIQSLLYRIIKSIADYKFKHVQKSHETIRKRGTPNK